MPELSAKDLLWEAVETPPAQRAALLDERCAGDTTLRERVEALLAAHERSERLFGKQGSTVGVARLAAVPTRSPDLAPGAELGSYRVLRAVGTGGFGTVYLAEQREPVVRRVALKVLHTGLGSAAARARFDAERQALARMEHPAIARVFDAGTTAAGQPWFAMEYLPGEPITDYVHARQLGLRETLALFREVCLAVQHAHQKGVVHRDLKPSNVIVIEVDGVAHPKVIDFGIAKAIDRPLTDHAVSIDGQLVGTPAYMSPEQAAGHADVDTRTDVYALGAVLYELLSGVPPFDVTTLSFTDLIRAIAEVDPPLPSRRQRAQGDADGGGTSTRWVPPDLDWVVMRCLEKERARRYASASQLAEELARFLDGLPVEAAPPSRGYRLKKLAGRHRVAVAAVGAFVLALVAGAVGTGAGLVRANRANERLTDALAELRREAEHAREAEARAAAEAENAVEQGRIASAINLFLTQDLLAAAVPSAKRGRGRDVTLREVLDVAAEALAKGDTRSGRFVDQPVVEAGIQEMLGNVYVELGELDAGVRHLRRAEVLRLRHLGPDHPDTHHTQRVLADQIARLGAYEEADALLEPVVAAQTETLGEAHTSTLLSRRDLGMLRYREGRPEEAYAIVKEAFEDAERTLTSHDRTTLNVLGSLAIVTAASGRLEEAEGYFRENLERRLEALGPEHPDTLSARINLAATLRTRGRNDEARDELFACLEVQRELLGPEHPAVGVTLYNLGSIAIDEGRFEDAEALLDEAHGIDVAAFGEDSPRTLRTLSGIARALEGLDRGGEAEALYRRAFEGTLAALGPEHPETDARRKDLSGFLYPRMNGDPELREEVTELIEASYTIQREHLGPTHPSTLRSLENLALLYGDQDRYEEGAELLKEAIDGFRAVMGPEHVDTLKAQSSLAGNYLSQGRFDESAALSGHVVEVAERTLHPESIHLARVRLRFGIALRELGRSDEARPYVEAAYEVLRNAKGDEHRQTRYARQELDALDAGG